METDILVGLVEMIVKGKDLKRASLGKEIVHGPVIFFCSSFCE